MRLLPQSLRCRLGRHDWRRDPLTPDDPWAWCPSCYALARIEPRERP